MASRLHGQSFIYPGIQTSVEAGLSQTNTRGASAVLSNPANIIETPSAQRSNKRKKQKRRFGIEPYADLSLASIEYTYTRSGYDPVRVSLTAPPVTLGLAWRPGPQFALGLLFVPRPATSPQMLSNVPQVQGGEVILVNSEAISSSVISGFGIGIQPTSKLSIGLSVIETAETGKLSAIPVEAKDGDVPLFQMSYEGSFLQFLLGTRIQIDDDTLFGASFKSSAVKKYTGDVSIGGGTTESTTKQGYLPMELALGVERRVDERGFVMAEYRYLGWSAGADSVRSGTPGGAEKKDLQNVNVIVLGGRYRITNSNTVSFGYGYYPANCGYGSVINSGGAAEGELIGGVEIGDFDALTRHVVAGGIKIDLDENSSYVQVGASMQNGSRTVPTARANEGTYKLNVYTLALGGGKSF